MGWHVVRPFGRMAVERVVLLHQALEEGLEVALHIGIGVLLDGERRRRVLTEEREEPGPDALLFNPARDRAGDLLERSEHLDRVPDEAVGLLGLELEHLGDVVTVTAVVERLEEESVHPHVGDRGGARVVTDDRLRLPAAVRETGRYGGGGALRAGGLGLRALPGVLRLARLARRTQADVIHTNGLKAHLLGGVAGRIARRPVVWHLRDFPPSGAGGRLLRMAARMLPAAVLANSDAVAATVPGVGLGFHSEQAKSTQYSPQISGGNGRNVNYVVDGGDNNDDTVGGLLQLFPLEAIQEFDVITQRFDAEFGRSNGAVLNVVTKSGTNDLRGSWFTLMRHDALNGRTFTERINDIPKQAYQRYQFGGSLGGPVVIPGVVLAVALFIAYTRPPLVLYGTLWILFVAYLTKEMPVGYAQSDATFRGIPSELEDAGRILGAGRLRVLRDVTAPLAKSGVIAAWCFIFIGVIRELSASIILFTPNTRVMSVVIFDLKEEGQFGAIAVLGLFMLAACGFSVLLFHPDSPMGPGDPVVRRALMGLAMGATAIALIYSPGGRRSGARRRRHHPRLRHPALPRGHHARLDPRRRRPHQRRHRLELLGNHPDPVLPEVLRLDPIRNQCDAPRPRPLRLVQPLCRRHHQISPMQKLLFKPGQRLPLHAREGGVFVHAVIDDALFAERPGDHGGGGIEQPVNRPLQDEPEHRPLHLKAKPSGVEGPDP